MNEHAASEQTLSSLATYIRTHGAAATAVAVDKLLSDPDMTEIARRRRLTEADHASQVASFWLEAVTSDLVLGAPVALERNLAWSLRLSEGHSLGFPPALYRRCFDAVCAGIDSLPLEEAWRDALADYKEKALSLIASVIGA